MVRPYVRGNVKLTEQLLQYMNVPRKLWNAKLELVPVCARAEVAKYLKDFYEAAEEGYGLVLRGMPQTGKSSVAALVAKRARVLGFTVSFVTFFDLRELLRTEETLSGAPALDRCRDVDVLVLDGFSETDRPDRFAGEALLRSLVTTRGDRKQVTIVTTTVDAKTWREDILPGIPYLHDLTLRGDDALFGSSEAERRKAFFKGTK